MRIAHQQCQRAAHNEYLNTCRTFREVAAKPEFVCQKNYMWIFSTRLCVCVFGVPLKSCFINS